MKGIKTVLGIALATISLGGAISVGAVANFSHEKSAIPAEAATNTYRFYCDSSAVSGYGSTNGESVAIQYYINGTWTKKMATYVANEYWMVDIPDTSTKAQFFRCKSNDINNTFNWQYETTNMSYNYCTVNGWDNNCDWSQTNGAYETYEVASTTASASTKRVWINVKDNFHDGNARAALRTYSGSTYKKTFVLAGSSQNITVNSKTLFYVDIPVDDDFQLVRLHNVFDIIWTYGTVSTSITGYNTAKIIYSSTANASTTAGNESSNVTVNYAKKVLDGYQTCDSSSKNGYGCYNNIKTQVLDKLSSANLTSLRSSTFTAPVYGSRTYGEKIDWMSSKSGASSRNIGEISQNSNKSFVIVAISTSAMLISLAGVYFILRKRRLAK